MGSLENCHEKLGAIFGSEIESVEVLRIADEHRCFWRPECVKTILLVLKKDFKHSKLISRFATGRVNKTCYAT
jgi:hypothetical protein